MQPLFQPEPETRREAEPEIGVAKEDWYVQGQKRIAEITNRTQRGNLDGYDCPDCLNRGWFLRVDDTGARSTVACKCMEIRKNLWRVERSGLADLIERYTFDNWKTEEPWQGEILNAAMHYADSREGWFAVCGRSGTGKTHICTAICSELLNHGISTKYMLWRDEATRIKAAVTDPEEYTRLLYPLKTVQCLYIDDLFKVGRGIRPTVGDVNLAFEILNYRYNNRSLITIISSELTVSDMIRIDEAVGSRIYERTKNGQYFDLRNRQNWRTKAVTEE